MNYQGIVKFGDRSEAVRWVQQRLIAHGIRLQSASGGNPIDGQFGTGTRNAVIEFQQKNGLLPDGIVGPQTWAALATTPVTVEPPTPTNNSTGGKSNSKPVTGWIEAERDKSTGSGSPALLLLGGLALISLLGDDSKRKSG
jgi:peptidoglycan hydrolase-like protein with peptidoglycan-binding domain